MYKSRRFKNAVFFSIIITSVIILIYFCSNPASVLKKQQIREIGLYASGSKTLWEAGYNSADFEKESPEAGSFEYNAVFKGDALNRLAESFKAPSQSYYTSSKKIQDYESIYIINIPISDDEEITLLTKNLYEESKGNFIGYKYKGNVNGRLKWIVYKNPKLGQILYELRSGK